MSENFVFEYTSHRRLKLLIFSVLFVLFLGGLCFVGYTFFGEAMRVESIKTILSLIYMHVKNFTVLGVFFYITAASIFVSPLGLDEVYFYTGLQHGNPLFLSLLMVFTAFFIAHCINYVVGSRLSHFVLPFIPLKKVYTVRRWVHKYGNWAILAASALPLPASLLVFSLGIMRYNVLRMFTFLFIGYVIKYSVVSLVAYLT